jgi:hypothetical protein
VWPIVVVEVIPLVDLLVEVNVVTVGEELIKLVLVGPVVSTNSR